MIMPAMAPQTSDHIMQKSHAHGDEDDCGERGSRDDVEP